MLKPTPSGGPLRGRRSAILDFTGRVALTCVGLAIFSVGLVLNLQANAGQAPWVALNYAIMLHTPLTYGQATITVGVVLVVVAALLGVRPGLGTLLNATIVGPLIDLQLNSGAIPAMETVVGAYAMLLLSLLVSSLGIASYIKAGIGAGPRDSLMLGLMRVSGRGPAPIRLAIEIAVTAVSFLLGAPLGAGTVVYAFAFGPSIGIWFKLLRVQPSRPRAQPAPRGAAQCQATK